VNSRAQHIVPILRSDGLFSPKYQVTPTRALRHSFHPVRQAAPGIVRIHRRHHFALMGQGADDCPQHLPLKPRRLSADRSISSKGITEESEVRDGIQGRFAEYEPPIRIHQMAQPRALPAAAGEAGETAFVLELIPANLTAGIKMRKYRRAVIVNLPVARKARAGENRPRNAALFFQIGSSGESVGNWRAQRSD
jgi:hypothetical protein